MRHVFPRTLRARNLQQVLSFALFATVATIVLAGSEIAGAELYTLGPGTNFGYGCYGPCACPVATPPMQGSFGLHRVDSDPLVTNYLVENFEATVTAFLDTLRLAGSGTYRIGGEVAIEHQMILDLTVGGVARHFDSGLVPGGMDFPAITIEVPANAFACLDTVLTLHALPATTDAGDPEAMAAAQAVPNPFRGALALSFRQRQAGPLDAVIFDASGRQVRRLAAVSWSPAGLRSIAWDGTVDQGTIAPSGVYFARIRAAGSQRWLTVVKLE